MATFDHGHLVVGHGDHSDPSRASTPGAGFRNTNGYFNNDDQRRVRPRTFPYFKYLPYQTEDQDEREANLQVCLKHLYAAVSAGDFAPGAVHWTRELRGWLSLKFDMPKETRIKLVKLYYELALAPGLDSLVAERFASMVMVLTKRKHYLRPGRDLTLDWRPLYKELKTFVLPSEAGALASASRRRNVRTLTKLCSFAQIYFDPTDTPAMFDEILPYFSTSYAENAFVVVGLLNLLLPTSPPPEDRTDLLPQQHLPTFFHLWSLVNRSRQMDVHFIDILSRLTRDCLTCPHIEWSAYGLLTQEQSAFVYTAILRVLELPVGQSISAYSGGVDLNAGLALLLDRDQRKHPISHHIARWIVMSLSPACLDKPDSVLANLEGLIEGIETFFHPSNSGNWTRTLTQLVYYLCDFFVMRWNRERSGEMDVPPERKLNDGVKRRFVLCLKEVVFMGIYSKSGTAMQHSISALQTLAFLEPDLILPGALQRIYPAMQGLVEVHRTISSIRALSALAKVMCRAKGYRCHVTTLLGLALPGIDPNDLDKTFHTLAYIQAIAYNIPFHDLSKEKVKRKPKASDHLGDDMAMGGRDTPTSNISFEDQDSQLAMRWITEQVTRLETEGVGVVVDYENELTDEEERRILCSSTTELAEFVTSFLGRVFTLLENLPDASRVRSGSPEENVVNTLPAAFLPLFASLSPELYDIALEKIAKFVTQHVIHQARDAMAFICQALVKVNPKKALARLLPELIAAIRVEIDDHAAGSTRTTGSEVYPRDRALVWYISILSMCVVHVGDSVLEFRQDLFDIAVYMQEKCRGVPTVHVSNFIHHLLLNLTLTYIVDHSLYELEDLERGLTTEDWGRYTDPNKLTIKWHTPNKDEIAFAIDLFRAQIRTANKSLKELLSDNSPVKRAGQSKDWSDEIGRNLVLIRLIISGVSVLFDFNHESGGLEEVQSAQANDDAMDIDGNALQNAEEDESLGDDPDEEKKPNFQYPTGYPLTPGTSEYEDLHALREQAGNILHMVHEQLAQDDVQCYNSLYNAYRSWLVDVGIERSAHVLDRVTRLFTADIHPFKFSGLRKEYPRSLLIRRANVYHLQRLRHNSHVRPLSALEKRLLLDLADSSVSLYTEIRRTAQSAAESALKCVIGGRALIIPPLLKALQTAIKESDNPRIKGAMFSLLYGSLAKTIGRDWRFTPTLIRCFIDVTTADKPSIQKLAENAIFSVMEMGKPLERMVILDQDLVKAIVPSFDEEEGTKIKARIDSRRTAIQKKRVKVENKKAALAQELVGVAKESHWKKARRTATLIINLGIRFETIASPELIDLLIKGAIDSHPSLRSLYSSTLMALFGVVNYRSLCKHDYRKYLLAEEVLPDKIQVPVQTDDPNWTKNFLAQFAQEEAKYYVDFDYPGWLVWNKTLPAFMPNPPQMEYDEVEAGVRSRIGTSLDRHWFSTHFAYLKQEPRDATADRFHMSAAMLLTNTFELVFAGAAQATFEDIKDLTQAVYGDGSDKHQHRATAEILGGLLSCATDVTPEQREQIWEYAFPIVKAIFDTGLTPENSSYWNSFLRLVLQGKDPRRTWPLVDWLASFRLNVDSDAAFKDGAKINLLNQAIVDAGWHFQLEKPILEDFLGHLDHKYKQVREAVGTTLACIYKTRSYEAYPDIKALMAAQKGASSLGKRAYEPSESFSQTVRDVFGRLEQWRKERPAGQQTPSSYTLGSKTVLLWLDHALSSYECTMLIDFFPDLFMEQLLHMMDIKEDPELQSLAYLVFRHMPNIPHRAGEDTEFINAMIRIGRTATSWHQRLRILLNIQVLYFRRLFLMSKDQQLKLYDCVSAMLTDSQLEVRMGAAATLSGMIRCSPHALRDRKIVELKKEFTDMLINNPLPRRARTAVAAVKATNEPSRSSTPTPEQSRLTLTRHAAVLGLGALVQAFPYTSPPPAWLPEVLTTLAGKAAADPGVVGKGVKSILADFKKTRQDTWHVDARAFEPDQLEDLEGVLWKSYFA